MALVLFLKRVYKLLADRRSARVTGNIGQFPTWVKLGSNLGNNNSQLLKLGFSWGKVGFYFES